ncbi:MAG: glycosyltransferase family 2 protein [Patescibacteria group bacterium]
MQDVHSTKLSIVIPIYNEAGNVAPLHKELLQILRTLGHSFEIIFIDDGSRDTTSKELSLLHPARVISFTRNFGKSQALLAGFEAAQGEIIITMDGDLQDDPHEIPNFLTELEKGYDLVCGWKRSRQDSSTKIIASKIANWITRVTMGLSIHDMNCCFKAYRSHVAKELHLHGDLHRYIPVLVHSNGYRITEIPVHHRLRIHGISKYGFGRFFNSSFDFLTLLFTRRFADRPLHFFGPIGILSTLTGMSILGYLAWIKIFDHALIGGRPLLILGTLLFLVGIQFLSLGLLGDLFIKQTSRIQKTFVIKNTRNQES